MTEIPRGGLGTGVDAECFSCGEGLKPGECPESRRECGHHCNHSWDQDQCCWCGAEFGEVPTITTNPKENPMPTDAPPRKITLEDLDDAQQNFLNAEMASREATTKRAETIRALLEGGTRQQAIADRLGISRGRVAQLARVPDAERSE
jgi:hypothetical protein